MTSEERERAIDRVPVGDPEAALRALVADLEREGELDEELAQTLAFRTGAGGRFWGLLIAARDEWRAARGLPRAPMPFALGE